MRPDNKDIAALLVTLRELHAWTQATMAETAQIHPTRLSKYETGTATPSPATLERLAAAARVPMWVVDGYLLPAIALARECAARTANAPVAPSQVPTSDVAAPLDLTAIAMSQFLEVPLDDSDSSSNAYLQSSSSFPDLDPWAAVLPAQENLQLNIPEVYEDLKHLIERICSLCERAVADDPSRALSIARVALRVADLLPADVPDRLRARGFALAFLSHALRASGDLPGAEAVLALSGWESKGAAQQDDPVSSESAGLFADWRLWDLEASLRRDQRKFDEALSLIARALHAAPIAARGRLVLKQASIYEQAGRIADALGAFQEAMILVDRDGDVEPRNRLVARFGIVVVLCHLDRYPDAEAALAELRTLAHDGSNGDDLLRLRWLTARVGEGMGRRQEALQGFLAVQAEYRRRGNPYDAALVSIEIALLYLAEGRIREVADLAEEMLWILHDQRVHREALVALEIFHRAAASHSLTETLARLVAEFLQRSRSAPYPFKIPNGRPRPSRRGPSLPHRPGSRRGAA